MMIADDEKQYALMRFEVARQNAQLKMILLQASPSDTVRRSLAERAIEDMRDAMEGFADACDNAARAAL